MNPTLVGLALTVLLAQLGTSIANVALPSLALAFAVSPGATQGVVSVYLVAVTLFAVLVGPWGDRWGRRRLILGGLGLFVVGAALAALATNLPWLLVARAVQGTGAAALIVFSMALVGEVVPPQKTGRAMGLLGTMNAVGTALGPSLGGLLLTNFGWPAVFAVLVPLGAVAGGLLWKLPVEPSPPGRTGVGLLPRDLRWAERIAALVQNGLAMSVLMATLVVGPFYLSGVLALDPARMGMVMTVGPLVVALAGIPSGFLVERWGARRLVGGGLAGMALGSLVLAFVPSAWGVAGYLSGLTLLTASFALFQTANNTAVFEGVSVEHRGATSGWLSLSRNLGLLVGTVGLGAFFAAQGSPVSTAFSLTFTLGSALLVVALGVPKVKTVRRTVL